MEYSQNLKDISRLLSVRSKLNLLRNKALNDQLNLETHFLDNHKYNSKIHRLWYINNNIYEIVKCPNCGKISYMDKSIIKCCSYSCTMTIKDSVTGLSKQDIASKHRFNTMTIKDSVTGLSKQDIASKRQSDTLKNNKNIIVNRIIKFKNYGNKIDIDTGLKFKNIWANNSRESNNLIGIDGLTGYQRSSITTKITKSYIDKDGLNSYDKGKIKEKITLSKIDIDTGLSGYDKKNKAHSLTLSKIVDGTDKTLSEINGLKSAKARKNNFITQVLLNFNDSEYKILTDINNYIAPVIKYQHDCGVIRESNWPYIRCYDCYPINISLEEAEVFEFCKSLIPNIESNNKELISPLELDIYIPEYNLAIEYNGIYWHSSNSILTENKNYHLNKTELCKSKGIQLFHMFSTEWQDPQKQEIWKSIIRNKLGKAQRIFARKTKVNEITPKEAKEFLNSNHLQGACMSSVNLGLKYNDELVAIMTFGRSRYDKKVDWELLRFCNKLGYSVIGGASKLLKSFQRENSGSIVSYADKRRSNGNLYEKLGFELSHESAPNYWYWNNDGLESRVKYQKHKLKDKLEIFNDKLTESENMYNNGYRKIYDCGNQVWKIKMLTS